jgi:hypothetical protein
MRGGREKRCECVRKRTPPYPFPPQYSKANRFAAPTRLPAFGCRAVFYPLPQLSRSRTLTYGKRIPQDMVN